MDLIRLKKLVLLANHNNSEEESTSAAKQACKLIEEANFVFRTDELKRKAQKVTRSQYDYIEFLKSQNRLQEFYNELKKLYTS